MSQLVIPFHHKWWLVTCSNHKLVPHEACTQLVREKVNCWAGKGTTPPSSQDPYGARTQAIQKQVMCVQVDVYVLLLDRVGLEQAMS